MMNYLFESTSYNPWKNLAIETHLANQVRPGELLLYLWQNENTVVTSLVSKDEAQVSEIDELMGVYTSEYEIATENIDAIRYQAKEEIAMKKMLDEQG